MLPTHFGHGLICNSLYPWLFGQQLIHRASYSAPKYFYSLADRRSESNYVSLLGAIHVGVNLKGSKPPQAKTFRRIHCGSAPLSAHLWGQIREWSGIREVYNAYGITETGSWVAGTTIGEFEPEDGLVGAPWGA